MSAIGKKVMVIHSRLDYSANGAPFPPIGAVGEIISEIDKYGEYDVMFHDYPCPVQSDTGWVTHQSMIVFIDDDSDCVILETQKVFIESVKILLP